MTAPRLRVFAGPNGSGKSTIKAELPPALTRIFVNADELEKEAKTTGFIDLSPFAIDITLPELITFHLEHYLVHQKHLAGQAKHIGLLGTRIDYRNVEVDYIFDNSDRAALWLAEITEGIRLEYRTEDIPDWFFESYVDQMEL
ncbi:hypothetical protein PPUJ20066_24870 [Pseudomonas putida]|nr:hypothetical protein PPUJ20066_24870 [Pseudomonas putida]